MEFISRYLENCEDLECVERHFSNQRRKVNEMIFFTFLLYQSWVNTF